MAPDADKMTLSYSRRSPQPIIDSSYSSSYGPRKSIGRYSQKGKSDLEGVSTLELIKRFEKELQICQQLRGSMEIDMTNLKERIETIKQKNAKPGSQKLEASLMQQLDNKISAFNGNEDKIKNLEDKLILLENTKELEEILENLKYIEIESKEKLEKQINTVYLNKIVEIRSEERRVGNECTSWCRARWSR